MSHNEKLKRMEDLPISAEIILKVTETDRDDCLGCFFDEFCGDIYNVICKNYKCSATDREDGKNVQFKRVM